MVTSAVQAALAHDTVAPPLKSYAENTQRYHPVTGTGCSGLSEEEEPTLEDDHAQPSTDTVQSACDSATPHRTDTLEEFKILLRNTHCRGITPHSVCDTHVSMVGGRMPTPLIPSTTSTLEDDTFQDAEDDER